MLCLKLLAIIWQVDYTNMSHINQLNGIDIDESNIVITGFGIFRDHQLNPSWECIKDDQFNLDIAGLNIVKKQIDVSYEAVDEVVPKLWTDYNPLLMVHIGLAAHESSIRIEQVARHGPFINDDILKCAPHKDLRSYGEGDNSLEENTIRHNYACKPCNFDHSTTCLDVDRICDKLNRLHEEGRLVLPVKKSTDAGLYVCEYIYQKSLRICNRAIFIHIPAIEKFKLEDIRSALEITIKALIEEVFTVKKKIHI